MAQQNIADGGIGTAAQGTLLALLSTLAVAASLLIAPILPQIIAAFPEDPQAESKVILALTIAALVVAISAPALGRVVERVGRKPVLLVSLVLYLIAGVAPFFLNNLDHLILSRVGVGLAEAGIMTASTALIGDYFKGSRREYWLVIQTGIAAISAVVFAAASGILGENSWRAPFLIYAMPLIYIPLIFLLIKEPVAETREVRPQVFAWRKVMPLYAIGFPAAILFFIIPIQTPFLLTERDLGSPQLIGMTGAIGGAAVAAGGLLFTRISSLGLWRSLGFAFTLIAVGLWLFVGDSSYQTTLAGVVVASLGCGMTLPAILTSIMARLTFEERGRGAGGWQTAFFLGNFASPLVALGLTKMTGALSSALLTLAVVAAIGALLCALSWWQSASNQA